MKNKYEFCCGGGGGALQRLLIFAGLITTKRLNARSVSMRIQRFHISRNECFGLRPLKIKNFSELLRLDKIQSKPFEYLIKTFSIL